MHLGLNLALAPRQSGGTPDVRDVFTYGSASEPDGNAMFAGMLGLRNDETSGQYLMDHDGSCSAFWVKGTACYLENDGGADASGPLRVTVDGGSETTVNRDGSNLSTLFTGLTDEWHFVSVQPGAAYDATVYIPDNSDVLTADGADVQFIVPQSTYRLGDGIIDYTAHMEAHGVTDFTPATWASANGGFVKGCASITFTGTFSTFIVFAKGTNLSVSVDGATPTRITKGDREAVTITAPDGASHSYVIVAGGSGGSSTLSDSQLSVAFVGGEDISTTKYPAMHFFGHSIVQGLQATSQDYVSHVATAIRNGYMPALFGTSGLALGGLDAALTTALSGLIVTSDDVAVIDMGRNDGSATMTAGEIADYTAAIDDLLAKGYGQVLCLGVMPINVDFSDFNASIQAIVATYTEDNVVYIDRDAYDETEVTAPDTIHPNDAGYAEIAVLDETYFDPSVMASNRTVAVPDQVTGVSGTPSDGQVALTWTKPSNNGAPVTGYVVKRDGSTITTTTNLAYTDTGVTNGVEYDYTVAATSSVGSGAPSATLTITAGTPVASGYEGLIWESPTSTNNSLVTKTKTYTADTSAADEGDAAVVIVLAGDSEAAPTVTSVDVGGNAFTKVGETDSTNEANSIAMFVGTLPASTSPTVTVVGTTSGAWRPQRIVIVGTGGRSTVATGASNFPAVSVGTSLTLDVNTTSNCYVVAAGFLRGAPATTDYPNLTGVSTTVDGVMEFGGNWPYSVGYEAVTTAASPRAVSAEDPVGTTNFAAAAVAFT